LPDTGPGVDPRPGRRLRARRAEHGWSLSRLERETHYSRGYLSRVENGVQRMTEDVAQACDRALGGEGELLAAVRCGDASAPVPAPSVAQPLADPVADASASASAGPVMVLVLRERHHRLRTLAAGASAAAMVAMAVVSMWVSMRTSVRAKTAHMRDHVPCCRGNPRAAAPTEETS